MNFLKLPIDVIRQVLLMLVELYRVIKSGKPKEIKDETKKDV